MMQNELNTSLIEAVKEKLPLKENLANLLIDTLYIGKEAIYRRLRGEVPFTLEEAALISRKLGVSLDNVIGVCFSSNAVFDLNVVDHEDPFETYYSLLKKYVNVLHALQNDPSSSMGTSSNIIPQTLSLKHKHCLSFASLNGCIKTSIFSASILTRWKFLKKYMIFKMILYLLPDIYILWIISGIA